MKIIEWHKLAKLPFVVIVFFGMLAFLLKNESSWSNDIKPPEMFALILTIYCAIMFPTLFDIYDIRQLFYLLVLTSSLCGIVAIEVLQVYFPDPTVSLQDVLLDGSFFGITIIAPNILYLFSIPKQIKMIALWLRGDYVFIRGIEVGSGHLWVIENENGYLLQLRYKLKVATFLPDPKLAYVTTSLNEAELVAKNYGLNYMVI